MEWFFFALLSASAAASTAILAKIDDRIGSARTIKRFR